MQLLLKSHLFDNFYFSKKDTWRQEKILTVTSISIGLQEVPTQGTTKMIGAHLFFIIITLILVTLYLYETI